MQLYAMGIAGDRGAWTKASRSPDTDPLSAYIPPLSSASHRRPASSTVTRLLVWDNVHGNVAELHLPEQPSDDPDNSDRDGHDAADGAMVRVPSLCSGIFHGARFMPDSPWWAESVEVGAAKTAVTATCPATAVVLKCETAGLDKLRIAKLAGGGALIPWWAAYGGGGRVAFSGYRVEIDGVAVCQATHDGRQLDIVATIPHAKDGFAMDVVSVKTGLDGGVLLFESGVVSETARLRWVALGTAVTKGEPKTVEGPSAGSALAASENLRNDVLLQLPVVPSSLKGWCDDFDFIGPPHLELPDGDFVLFVSQGIYEYERGFFLCAVWRIRWDGGSVLETAWSTLIDFYASKSGTDVDGELLVMLSELTGEVAVVDARTGKDRSTPDPSPSAGETLTFEQADVQIPNLRDIYSVRKLLWRTVPRAWAAPSPPRKERKKSKPSNAAADDSSCGDVDVKVGGDGDGGDEPAIEWVASGLDSGTSDLVSILRLRRPVDAVEEDAERDSWHLTVTPARRVAEVGYADAIAAVLPTQNGDENAVRARACQLPGDAIKALANISGKWNGARSMPVLRVTAGQGFVAVTGKTHKFLVVRLSELT